MALRPARPGGEAVPAPPNNFNFVRLTDQPGVESFPSLSPDGDQLAYAALTSGNWDIYTQRVGGKNPVNLAKDSADDDRQPAFSTEADVWLLPPE